MTDEQAIVVHQRQSIAINGYEELQKFGEMFVASGMFPNIKKVSQAMVKIIAGREMGIGPFAAMNGMNIIQGRCVPDANLMAAAVKADPRYNYRVEEHTTQVCKIVFFENNEEIGCSRFTIEDAQAAGLTNKDNWRKYPRNMLFARALSNGAKWFCPDAFPGPVYVAEELGDNFNVVDYETGEVIAENAEPEPEPQSEAPPPPKAATDSKPSNAYAWHERTALVTSLKRALDIAGPHAINKLKKAHDEEHITSAMNDVQILRTMTEEQEDESVQTAEHMELLQVIGELDDLKFNANLDHLGWFATDAIRSAVDAGAVDLDDDLADSAGNLTAHVSKEAQRVMDAEAAKG